MKKIIALLLAVLMLATVLCACGGDEATTSTDNSSSTPSASEPANDDTASEPEVLEPAVGFGDLETFEGVTTFLGLNYMKVPFWKFNIDGANAVEDKKQDPFNKWRELTVTFDEGRAPTALGIEAAVDTVFVSALNDIVNDIKIYFAELTEDDKATLEAEVAKLTNAKISEVNGKICVSFAG